jgi:hypothetical protein
VVNVNVHVAAPVAVFTGCAAHPAKVTAPSLNATVPPSGAAVTVAVNVTGFPATTGLAEVASTVDVDNAWFTTCDSIADVLGTLPDPPRNAAVTGCDPIDAYD